MMKRTILLLVVLGYHLCFAQKGKPGGEFQLGMRQTFSFFGDEGAIGMGTGGQFRLMLAKRLNTEWFADYIHTDINNLGKRVDGHIGWSVMFYVIDPYKKDETRRKVLPYLLAGHCFDYTRVSAYNTLVDNNSGFSASRWSSAVQAGLGTHFFLGERFNLSASCQYMLHLGNDIGTHVEENNGIRQLVIEQNSTNNKLTFEGHLLFTLSLNVSIADLW